MKRTTIREHVDRAPEPACDYDDRALRRLRHRDLAGLVGLMDDYRALADELEEIGGPPTRRHAA